MVQNITLLHPFQKTNNQQFNIYIYKYSFLTNKIAVIILLNQKIHVSLFGILRTIMDVKIISDKQQRMARFAKAMGHPVRLYVLDLLSKQSCCYSGDISEILPIAKSTLSQHLKELKDAGLIQGEIEAPKVKYCINKANWDEAKLLFRELFEK